MIFWANASDQCLDSTTLLNYTGEMNSNFLKAVRLVVVLMTMMVSVLKHGAPKYFIRVTLGFLRSGTGKLTAYDLHPVNLA